jgi:3-oxoacyl-[acyl-carrier protein] reductase
MWSWKQAEDFTGRVAAITGGSRGIGLATARAFLERGARVGICAQDSARLRGAERQLSGRGELLAVPADLRDTAQLRRYIHDVQDRLGAIDVLVNNAGLAWSGSFAAQPEDSIDAIVDVNVTAVLHATRMVLPQMLQRRAGVVVNVSSGAGLNGLAGLATYCASKFAVVGFTASLAQEVAGQGVRVHAICPGRVATDMQQQVSGAKVGMRPERVAETILALAGSRPPARPGECLILSG